MRHDEYQPAATVFDSHYFKVPKALAAGQLKRKPPSTMIVLCAIVDKATGAKSKGFCYAGHSALAVETGYGKSTVRRAIGTLQELGYIDVEQRVGTTNIIHINWKHPELINPAQYIDHAQHVGQGGVHYVEQGIGDDPVQNEQGGVFKMNRGVFKMSTNHPILQTPKKPTLIYRLMLRFRSAMASLSISLTTLLSNRRRFASAGERYSVRAIRVLSVSGYTACKTVLGR